MKRKVLAGILTAATIILVLPFAVGCNGTTTPTSTTETSTSTPTSPTTTSTKITLNTTVTLPAILEPAVLPNSQVQRITASELATMMNNDEAFLVVDTRSTSAYAQAHIPGAINMSSYPPGTPWTNQLNTLPLHTMIIFYCD